MNTMQNERADCSVRATAAALGLDYSEAHQRLAALGRKRNRGVKYRLIAAELGLEARPDLSARTLGKILPDMQSGRFVVRVYRHVFAVVNGLIVDNKPTNLNCRVKMVYQVL